jgi:hypothetical protein
MVEPAYAWAGDIATFVATSDEDLLGALTRFLRETRSPQLLAWHRSISALREQFRTCLPDAGGFGLVLEFELPRSGGRRPDLIVLENGTVLVVEFKNRVEVEQADLDQVRGYVRELEDYHAGCQGRRLVPVLVPIGMRNGPFQRDGVRVVPPSMLANLIREFCGPASGRPADVGAWTSAPCHPLPTLVEAARLLFERQPLPRIRRAESAGIPAAVSLIESVVREAAERNRRSLVLVAGVPGSGKTLLGLQLVHSRRLPLPAVFVSGNGPLVQVLQYALGGGNARREFVQDLRSFLRDNLIRSQAPCRERVVVFDEAQRAWDRDRVLLKHRGRLVGSEPELLVRIADRSPDEPLVLVALIGEGQEIHAGEEAGIAQWVEAVRASQQWQVVAPEHLAQPFRVAGLRTRVEQLLNLTSTLRSHRALLVARWVDLLLSGRLSDAANIAVQLRNTAFTLYAARDLEALREYARHRYASDPAKRYGVLVSSKYRKVNVHGIQPLQARYWYYGEWYEGDPTHPRSGCGLKIAVTEFGCQGLELDLPLVCWGPDLTWSGTEWVVRTGRSRHVIDPVRIRKNAYRVLLTRGRDGLCLFVPREPVREMDLTYSALLQAGAVQFPG